MALGCILLTMGRKLDRLMREAIETAALSEGQLAELAGRHPVSFTRYKTGERPTTPRAARDLADALEVHSREMQKYAEALREEAAKDEARRSRRRT
jgi:ribosome-binding protein aMBF1 (putative translation factor)